mmetsp:Transcript_35624/g.82261  ORF Transcript_35624/g.82261 Transcript_35624/m.82261 type:complete len:222 (-) Transcript_35624:151-816(-)
MATASFGEMRGSTLPSGIFRFVKSNLINVGSSRCARWTIHIIQFPSLVGLDATASFSRALSSVGSVQASTRFTKSSSNDSAHSSASLDASAGSAGSASFGSSFASSIAAWAAAWAATSASRSMLLRRRPRFSFCSAQAFLRHHPKPMSSRTFSMVAQASVHVLTRWSPQFMSDKDTPSRTVRILAILEQSPPKISASSCRLSLVLVTIMVMKSRASSKVFK